MYPLSFNYVTKIRFRLVFLRLERQPRPQETERSCRLVMMPRRCQPSWRRCVFPSMFGF